MIALSLRQPWCFTVLRLGKDIENRDWSTDYRGEFLIHASKGMTKDEYYGCLEFCRQVVGREAVRDFPVMPSLERGGIVGAARLVDVIPPCADCVFDKDRGELAVHCGRPHGWHMPWKYGFRLERVRQAPRFVPCKGMLGFFKVPAEVGEELRRAA